MTQNSNPALSLKGNQREALSTQMEPKNSHTEQFFHLISGGLCCKLTSESRENTTVETVLKKSTSESHDNTTVSAAILCLTVCL